jgi:hypothetical protein
LIDSIRNQSPKTFSINLPKGSNTKSILSTKNIQTNSRNLTQQTSSKQPPYSAITKNQPEISTKPAATENPQIFKIKTPNQNTQLQSESQSKHLIQIE